MRWNYPYCLFVLVLTITNYGLPGGIRCLAMHNHKLTIIVVPQTAKRSFSFTFTPVWLVAATLFVAGLAGGFWFYQNQAEALRSELSELESLRKTNRVQQSQIEEMHQQAQVIQERIQELETLEQQIKQLTGQTSSSSSRSGDSRQGNQQGAGGRGGPQASAIRQENLPVLSTLLPSDVKEYVVGRRNTLALDLKLSHPSRSLEKTVETAEQTNITFTEQLKQLARSKEALAQGKQDIADRLDFLAHRPTGLPIYGARITDRFGWRWSPFGWGEQQHDGMDFAADYWTPIYATADGVVIQAGWKTGGYGYAVMIDHGYSLQTLYAHMVDWKAQNGDRVKRGDLIGWVGNTGLSTGPHLHYEVHLDGVAVDPTQYLQ